MLHVSYTSNPLINLDYSCIKPWVDAHGKFGLHQIATTSTPVKTFNIAVKLQSKSLPQKETLQLGSIILNSKADAKLEDQHSSKVQISDAVFTESDGQRKDLALQCQNLLRNITAFSKDDRYDHLIKLKADLLDSINLLKNPPSVRKRFASEYDNISSKKTKIDSSIRDDSSEENSYITDEEIIGFQISGDKETEICNETVEVIRDELSDSAELLNETSQIVSHLENNVGDVANIDC